MSAYISHLQLANALLYLLLAAQLLALPALRPHPKRLLALNYLLYGHQSIALVAILSGQAHIFLILRPLGAMLLGPGLYAYFSCVRRQAPEAKPRDAAHLLLAILVFGVLYLVPSWRAFIDWAIPASFLCYFLLIAWQMRGDSQAFAHLGGHAPSAQRWLTSLMLMAFINLALELAVTLEMAYGSALRDAKSLLVASAAFLLLNTLTMLAALRRSDWLEWMYLFGEKALPGIAPGIDEEQLKTVFRRWETLVNSENLHKLEFGITLAQAAKKLGVPARQLSSAINQVYGQSFSVYLNDRRIEEARQLLLATPEMPVIAVMQEAGFSSKSHFNKEFLRVTGMSPSQFRHASLPAAAPG
ncbi:AraC family transcriptional regulator [Pseudoduganella violacea]|uniref:AraC-like DNA-binding protein n=1 Tax=Pseudoduganella violacea TaxID=1715466 RepID=A0A7W5BEQ6_9BURK|nr:helix-turn-helix domain-containing protein [Pseudoduganella violacea]MBB3121754.1 AraC-like DNA-binding protein [Pseudoduganella violacea]